MCDHHLCLVLKYFCHPQKESCTHCSHAPSPTPSRWRSPVCCLSLDVPVPVPFRPVALHIVGPLMSVFCHPPRCSQGSCCCVSLPPSFLCQSLSELATLDTAPPRPPGLPQHRWPLSRGCHQRHCSTSENQTLPWAVGGVGGRAVVWEQGTCSCSVTLARRTMPEEFPGSGRGTLRKVINLHC